MHNKFEDAKVNKINDIAICNNVDLNDVSRESKNKSIPHNDSQTSDYIDENFELDETDELWGLNRVNYENLKELKPNRNDI